MVLAGISHKVLTEKTSENSTGQGDLLLRPLSWLSDGGLSFLYIYGTWPVPEHENGGQSRNSNIFYDLIIPK